MKWRESMREKEFYQAVIFAIVIVGIVLARDSPRVVWDIMAFGLAATIFVLLTKKKSG